MLRARIPIPDVVAVASALVGPVCTLSKIRYSPISKSGLAPVRKPTVVTDPTAPSLMISAVSRIGFVSVGVSENVEAVQRLTAVLVPGLFTEGLGLPTVVFNVSGDGLGVVPIVQFCASAVSSA